MSWEGVVITAFLVMTVVHLIIVKTYTSRIRQFEADLAAMDSVRAEDEIHLEEAIIGRVQMSAQAKVDRDSNIHVIIINIICLASLSIMVILSHAGQIEAVGWMSLLLLPIPGVLIFYHLHITLARSIKKGW